MGLGNGLKNKILLCIALVIVFFIQLGLAMKYPISSDSANVLLAAKDIVDGNILLHGWILGNESFYTTDIPFYVLGILLSGFHYELGYIIPTLMYTLVIVFIFLLSNNGTNLVQRLLVISAIVIPSEFLSKIVLWPGIHTGAMVFVLFSLWFLYRKQNKLGYMIFLTLACIGDPFIIYFAVVPLLCVHVIEWIRDRKNIDAIIFILTLASVVISKLFLSLVGRLGGFTFSEGFDIQFIPLESLSKNVMYTIGGVLELYHANFFGRKIFDLETVMVCFHLLVVLGVITVIIKSIQNKWKDDIINKFLLTACLINILEYVFSTLPVGLGTVRYLFPFLVFSAMLASRVQWVTDWTNKNKKISVVLALIITLTFITPIDHKLKLQSDVTDFLKSRNLTNGYGSYWLASSNTLTSDDKVKIRPVRVYQGFRIEPMMIYANSEWYKDEAHFLIYISDINDGDVNQKTAEETFGKPDEIHKVLNVTILIWNKNISLK